MLGCHLPRGRCRRSGCRRAGPPSPRQRSHLLHDSPGVWGPDPQIVGHLQEAALDGLEGKSVAASIISLAEHPGHLTPEPTIEPPFGCRAGHEPRPYPASGRPRRRTETVRRSCDRKERPPSRRPTGRAPRGGFPGTHAAENSRRCNASQLEPIGPSSPLGGHPPGARGAEN
jgi:hypothetical protein